MLPAGVRSYLAEPAVPGAPARVRRDWVVVGVATVVAALEAALRHDVDFGDLSAPWRIAMFLAFAAVVPYALLIRRRAPLRAVVVGFSGVVCFGLVLQWRTGRFGGAVAGSAVLIAVYALYRWGSGRDGAIGAGVLAAAAVLCNLSGTTTLSDVIGGAIVLSIPVEAGLVVRYRATARERAIADARSRERLDLARELHDTVAHHVSAIAVQAQAGQAVAATDPAKAIEVLSVIEAAASRTLTDMRAMVGTLRQGTAAELEPREGVADLHHLAARTPGLRVEVDLAVDPALLDSAVDAAVYRIAQEAVTNAIRHARHASEVRVEVGRAADADDPKVVVRVTDDGIGGAAHGDRPTGYGLLGMTERAHLLGGTLHAGPLAGRGWEVVATLPLGELTSATSLGSDAR